MVPLQPVCQLRSLALSLDSGLAKLGFAPAGIGLKVDLMP